MKSKYFGSILIALAPDELGIAANDSCLAVKIQTQADRVINARDLRRFRSECKGTAALERQRGVVPAQ